MKKNDKQRLFEVMGKVNPDFNSSNDNTWAIFIINYGRKHFVTSVNANDTIGSWESDIKYNDPKVLKFTLERAQELVDKNRTWSSGMGIVNNFGIQFTKGRWDSLWQKRSLE